MLRLFYVLAALSFCHFAEARIRPDHPSLVDSPEYWMLGEGAYTFSIDGNYVLTTENYNSLGLAYTPTSLTRVEASPSHLRAAYGVAPSLTIFGQLGYSYIQISNPATSGVAKSNNTGLGDALVGGRFSFLYNRQFELMNEFSITIPMYGDPEATKAPLGDQTTNYTWMARGIYRPHRLMSLSAGAGYTYRSTGYSREFPYLLRGDLRIPNFERGRGWLELIGYESANTDKTLATTNRMNEIPGGSFIYRGINPSQMFLGGGLGMLVDRAKEWEISGSYHTTVRGKYAALESVVGIGISFRPKSGIPKNRTDNEVPADKDSSVRTLYNQAPVYQYGYSAKIEKVSSQGNFAKVSVGAKDGVQIGDMFHIFLPGKEAPFARASVAAVKPSAAFLRLEEYYTQNQERLYEGLEARRVIPLE